MNLRVTVEGAELDLERVAFDSEIFNVEVARVVDCKARDRAAAIAVHRLGVAKAREAGFVHVSRRVLGDDRDEIAALERAGYAMVDNGVIFDHDLKGVAPALPNGVKIADEADVARIVDECAAIFRGSRYYHDPVFDEAGADEIHRKWIWNCFRGRADAILMLEDVMAFVTCAVDKDKVGNIALFGVAPSAQGRGAGQRMLAGALAFFARSAARVTVKTQASNYAASRMYEKGGFRLFRSELTYAKDLREASS